MASSATESERVAEREREQEKWSDILLQHENYLLYEMHGSKSQHFEICIDQKVFIYWLLTEWSDNLLYYTLKKAERSDINRISFCQSTKWSKNRKISCPFTRLSHQNVLFMSIEKCNPHTTCTRLFSLKRIRERCLFRL